MPSPTRRIETATPAPRSAAAADPGAGGADPRTPEGEGDLLPDIIRHSPHGLAVTEGPEHVLRAVNPAFCALMHVNAADVLGRHYADAFGEPGGNGPLALLDGAFRSGDPVADAEVDRPRSGDRQEVWSYTIWPRGGEGHAPPGLVVEVTDRTGAVEARRTLEEMAEQIRGINERLLRSAMQEQDWAERAEAASRAKSDFLSMMSHELRTPLTGILGYTEVLETEVIGPVNDRQRESLERIRQCSGHLLELIEDVLTFAQVEAKALKVQMERTDLCAIAREAAAVVQPVAARKGLALEVMLPEAEVATETDPKKLRQILLNLLSNAVKFTDRGAVRLELRQEADEILLVVADTGIGIAAADLDRVFEPFTQTAQVNTRTIGGTGLGLPISRALAVNLGGHVSIRSTPGQGSTFAVHLPAA
jgi:signal transduction histidine kinase